MLRRLTLVLYLTGSFAAGLFAVAAVNQTRSADSLALWAIAVCLWLSGWVVRYILSGETSIWPREWM